MPVQPFRPSAPHKEAMENLKDALFKVYPLNDSAPDFRIEALVQNALYTYKETDFVTKAAELEILRWAARLCHDSTDQITPAPCVGTRFTIYRGYTVVVNTHISQCRLCSLWAEVWSEKPPRKVMQALKQVVIQMEKEIYRI